MPKIDGAIPLHHPIATLVVFEYEKLHLNYIVQRSYLCTFEEHLINFGMNKMPYSEAKVTKQFANLFPY